MVQVERTGSQMWLYFIYPNGAYRLISRRSAVWSEQFQLDDILKDHIIDVLLVNIWTEVLLWGTNQSSLRDRLLAEGVQCVSLIDINWLNYHACVCTQGTTHWWSVLPDEWLSLSQSHSWGGCLECDCWTLMTNNVLCCGGLFSLWGISHLPLVSFAPLCHNFYLPFSISNVVVFSIFW